MVGIRVRYFCPKCDCERVTDLGCTSYINYKNRKLAVLFCNTCNEKLACETADAKNLTDIHTAYKDETGLNIVGRLEEHFNSKGYTSETSESIIESEMWQFAIDSFGNIARYNESEIKSIIQTLMCQYNRGSLFAVTMEELNKESEEAGKKVWEPAGVICW